VEAIFPIRIETGLNPFSDWDWPIQATFLCVLGINGCGWTTTH